jgi:hypothetical protein
MLLFCKPAAKPYTHIHRPTQQEQSHKAHDTGVKSPSARNYFFASVTLHFVSKYKSQCEVLYVYSKDN